MNRELTALAARIDTLLQKCNNQECGYLMGGASYYENIDLMKVMEKIMKWTADYIYSWGENPQTNMIYFQAPQAAFKIVRTKIQLADGSTKNLSLKLLFWHDGSLHLMDPSGGVDGDNRYIIAKNCTEKDFINALHYAFIDTDAFFWVQQGYHYKKHIEDSSTCYGPRKLPVPRG
jgi:hypothetical protein